MGPRLTALLAATAIALAGCGGGDDGGGDSGNGGAGNDKPAITKSEADERVLRTAVDNYRRDTTQLIAGIRSGLGRGDYDDKLNNDVYDLRVVIYRFDQALRRITFDPSIEAQVNQILTNDSVAIGRLDPIIEAKRWPDDTADRVKNVLGDIEDTKAKVNALLGRV